MRDYYEIFLELFNIRYPKLVFSSMLFIFAFFTVYETKQYHNIFFHYPELDAEFKSIDGGWLHVSSPQNTLGIKDQTTTYAYSSNYLRIDLGFPKSLFLGKIDIPASSIIGCSYAPNGNTPPSTIFVLKENNMEVTIDNADFKEWCWQNQLPVFSSGELGEWIYNEKPLPTAESIQYRLASKDIYYEEFRKAKCGCSG